jgi:hypothetical protein
MKHELETIEFGIIPVTNYRGCVVYKTESGYYIFNQEVLTPQDVDALIDLSLTTIQNSLTKK